MMKKQKENLCLECPDDIRGLCCYYSIKFKHSGLIISLSNYPCEHLDTKTKTCREYDRRKEIKFCLPIKKAKKQGILPKGCPYVKDDGKYQKRKTVVYELPEDASDYERQVYDMLNNKYKREVVMRFLKG